MGDKGGILGINYDFAACPCSPEHRERSASLPSSWELKDVVPAVVKRSRRIQPLTLLPFTEGAAGWATDQLQLSDTHLAACLDKRPVGGPPHAAHRGAAVCQ